MIFCLLQRSTLCLFRHIFSHILNFDKIHLEIAWKDYLCTPIKKFKLANTKKVHLKDDNEIADIFYNFKTLWKNHDILVIFRFKI